MKEGSGPASFRETLAKPRILLVVENDNYLLGQLTRLCHQESDSVALVRSAEEALRSLENSERDVLFYRSKRFDQEIFRRWRESQPSLSIILLLDESEVGVAVELMKIGAYDYLTLPLQANGFKRLIADAADERRSKARFFKGQGC